MHLSAMFSLKQFSAILAQVINELKLDPVNNVVIFIEEYPI
ncbi:hypothetical protein F652_1746 [Enterobacteriaceae bacterium bta3-1]|nr:hypothetical protein F652_1746 [Enterobacteriaceae bacterium bta3-1]